MYETLASLDGDFCSVLLGSYVGSPSPLACEHCWAELLEPDAYT
jgi:hypothetical protein